MEKQEGKPAKRWLKLSVVGALVIGLCFTFEMIATGGRRLFPSVGLIGDKTYTLRITGENSMKFCGTISITAANGKVTEHDVDGVVPETFDIMGRSVSVTLRKCEANGTLRLVLANSSETKAEGFTTRPYSSVELGVN